jgi:hypothetical protein
METCLDGTRAQQYPNLPPVDCEMECSAPTACVSTPNTPASDTAKRLPSSVSSTLPTANATPSASSTRCPPRPCSLASSTSAKSRASSIRPSNSKKLPYNRNPLKRQRKPSQQPTTKANPPAGATPSNQLPRPPGAKAKTLPPRRGQLAPPLDPKFPQPRKPIRTTKKLTRPPTTKANSNPNSNPSPPSPEGTLRWAGTRLTPAALTPI